MTTVESLRRQQRIAADIREERYRQDAKFGDQSGLSRERMLVVLMEEVGEAADACLGNGRNHDLRHELLQVAAVAVQMIEHIDADAAAQTEGALK